MSALIPAGDPSPIAIRSDRLSVEIAVPGTVYNRTRFDWTGFVTQVTLDGVHTFCVPEDYNPNLGTGGIGICNEFGIEKSIGYLDAKPGEPFPKLGIGLLTRPDEGPYNFFKPHAISQLFPIHVETGVNEARFTVDPIDCRGYALRETKTLRVEENCLMITYQLENVGSQAVSTHEYAHNFIGIDDRPLGPDYHLHLPYPIQFEQVHESYRGMLPRWLQKIMPGFILEMMVKRVMSSSILRVEGQDIHWKETPQKSFYCRPIGFSQTNQPQWEIRLDSTGVGAREYDDFAPARVALWGTTHVVSAEVFIDINLQPGESQSWTRRFEFFSQ